MINNVNLFVGAWIKMITYMYITDYTNGNSLKQTHISKCPPVV